MNINTPQNAFMVNQYTETGDKSDCNSFNSPNNFGNYFDRCTKGSQSAYWGSNQPVKDNCLNPQSGKPCHFIWNNSTKRKVIVDYDRGQIIQNINVPHQNVMPSNRGSQDPPETKVDPSLPAKQDIIFAPPLCRCDCNCN